MQPQLSSSLSISTSKCDGHLHVTVGRRVVGFGSGCETRDRGSALRVFATHSHSVWLRTFSDSYPLDPTCGTINKEENVINKTRINANEVIN
jgi:hypothetical protein